MPNPVPLVVRFESDGFVVRDPNAADRNAIVALADDERLFDHMMIRFTREEMNDWFSSWLEEVVSSDRSFWSLVIETGGVAIGFALLSPSASDQVAELQWYVAPKHWGRGAATVATRLVLPYLFDVLGVHRVFATADPANEASVRTLERAGFRLEGHMRDYVLAHNGWRDRLLYALLDFEWRKSQDPRVPQADVAVAPDGSPVSLYLKMDGKGEAAFIHAALAPGAAVLELGSGAGRITKHLVDLGHTVTAVDNGVGMLAELADTPNVETVLCDIEQLDLAPRRWPVVLLASHLINTAEGPLLLAAAARHVEEGGSILLQRHQPGWVDNAEPSRSERPGLTIDMGEVRHLSPGVMSAVLNYEIDGHKSSQAFTAYEVDDERLAELAADCECEVVEALGSLNTWLRLRPLAKPA